MVKILFLTSPERGQANVHLATLHSLLTRYNQAGLELHLGSHAELQALCPAGVKFHAIHGQGISKYLVKQCEGYIDDAQPDHPLWSATHHPTVVDYIRAAGGISVMLDPMGPRTVDIARDVERIIAEIKPDLTVVDSYFTAAKDATRRLGIQWVILSPNTLFELAREEQGLGAFSWSMTGLGYPYPLPWYIYPINVFAMLLFLPLLKRDPYYKAVTRARHAAGYTGPSGALMKREVTALCMSTPALEYPAIVPTDLVCCGPILLPTNSLQQQFPGLFGWVTQRPTVMIALGSHLPCAEKTAWDLYASLRVLLDKRQDVQILWKLRKYKKYDFEPNEERIRVVEWLDADPTSILPHVIAVINHGGSNSYHEALARLGHLGFGDTHGKAGVPQIILSPWWDCHDFGSRAEWLKIGRWGNKKHAPGVDHTELAPILLEVIGATPDAPSAKAYRKRAQECADVAAGKREAINGPHGPVVAGSVKEPNLPGRDKAADWIYEHSLQASS